MNQLEDAIAGLRQRLGSLHENLAADFEVLLETVGKIEVEVEQRDDGQRDLVDELSKETSRAESLGEQLRDSADEVGRLRAELDSKSELVKALRRQLDESAELKSQIRQRDEQLDELRRELERKQGEFGAAQSENEALRAELEEANSRASEENAVDSAELAALKTELEARKSMIRSLKADAERTDALRAQLDSKRATINELEEAVDGQTQTIAELRLSVESWRSKYRSAIGKVDVAADAVSVQPRSAAVNGPDPIDSDIVDDTISELATFSESEIEALKSFEEVGDDPSGRTIAIDMRDTLQQASNKSAGADSS